MAAEQSNRPALAVKAYRELGKVLAASKDEKIAGTAAPMLGAARRLELVGKPFVLEGSTVAGKPLDWKKYRGKVVLIDFFATWCGPCREEMPNIMKCYKAYRKRGFDVVGISIDHDRKAIEDFVEKEKYPWTVLLDRNEARGTDKSMATYYGIFTIPQMILVGKDGKVLALNVRGEQLGKKLEELLGPADTGRASGRPHVGRIGDRHVRRDRRDRTTRRRKEDDREENGQVAGRRYETISKAVMVMVDRGEVPPSFRSLMVEYFASLRPSDLHASLPVLSNLAVFFLRRRRPLFDLPAARREGHSPR